MILWSQIRENKTTVLILTQSIDFRMSWFEDVLRNEDLRYKFLVSDSVQSTKLGLFPVWRFVMAGQLQV